MAAVKALRFNNCWVVDHTEMVKGDLVSGEKVISPFSLVQCLVVDLADSHWERHPPSASGSVAVWSPSPICHSPKKLHISRYRNGWQSPFWPTPCITLNEKITHWTSWKPSCIIGEYFNCSGRLEILMTPLNILSKKWISFWNGRCGKQIILNFKKEPSRQARLFMLHQSIPYWLGLWLQALDLLKWAGIKTSLMHRSGERTYPLQQKQTVIK